MPVSRDMVYVGRETLRAPELPALTSLRGIAAVAVVAYHCSALSFSLAQGAVPFIAARGYLAVDLFFFLSGFVLTHVYGRQVADECSWGVVRKFLWARVCRIYPAAIFTALVYAVIYPSGVLSLAPGAFARQFLAAVTLMQVPWLDPIVVNGPGWSVSAELYAYLLFLILAPAIMRWRATALALLMMAMMLAICIDHALVVPDRNWGWSTLARALPEFIAGMAMYRVYQSPLHRLFCSDAALLVIMAALACGYFLAVSDAVIVPLLPPLLLASVSNAGHLGRWLDIRPLRWLGDISYSVYIFQMVPLTLMISLSDIFVAVGIRGTLYEITAFCLVLGFGAIVHRRVDVPARAALRRLPVRWAAIAAPRKKARPAVISAMLNGK
jgi:peptidoglycan/LPS O-acetylase OafA/YrhL